MAGARSGGTPELPRRRKARPSSPHFGRSPSSSCSPPRSAAVRAQRRPCAPAYEIDEEAAGGGAAARAEAPPGFLFRACESCTPIVVFCSLARGRAHTPCARKAGSIPWRLRSRPDDLSSFFPPVQLADQLWIVSGMVFSCAEYIFGWVRLVLASALLLLTAACMLITYSKT